MNRAKAAKVRALFAPYRATAVRIARMQWRLFFETGHFDRHHAIKAIASDLSERYKQTIAYQVVGTLASFISNRANDFRSHVIRSSLPDAVKHQLLYVNAAQGWYLKSAEIDGQPVPAETLRLARTIMRHVLAKHRQPDLSNCNLALDAKVAKVSPRLEETEKARGKVEPRHATHFAYWVNLSTVMKGQPEWIPLESNEYFDAIPGNLKNFLQINLDRDGGLHFMLIKDVPAETAYTPACDLLPLDFGLATMFATPDGGLFGRHFLEKLKFFDGIISMLARERQKQGLRVRSRRYDDWVTRLRAYLKNEINRVLNRLVDVYAPQRIVVERLDFRHSELSRRLNRIIRNCGRHIVQEKLQALQEQFGIDHDEVNPAYTSKECSVCHYVAPNNRPSQKEFKCRWCGSHLHADVNASRNQRNRSSDEEVGSVYLNKQEVLKVLTERFVGAIERDPADGLPGRLDSRARTLLQSNPYFARYFQEDRAQNAACS